MNYRSFAVDEVDDNTPAIYSLATAIVKQARKDARDGDDNAIWFLADWREHFESEPPKIPRKFQKIL